MARNKKQEKDIDFEIRFYEGILKRKDDFVQVLTALGELYTKKGLYEKGLEMDRKLSVLRPEDPLVFYNLACSYSLLNYIDEAFRTIKQAIRNGYDDFQYLAQDRDLENLVRDGRFQRYISRLTERSIRRKENRKNAEKR